MSNWKDIYKIGEKYADYWGRKSKEKTIGEIPKYSPHTVDEACDYYGYTKPLPPTPINVVPPATHEEFEELVKILESYMRIHNIKNYDGIGLIEELDAQNLDGVIASLNQEELVELYQRVRQLLSLRFKETQSEETAS